jgi:hypothetical protein
MLGGEAVIEVLRLREAGVGVKEGSAPTSADSIGLVT